MKIFKWVPISTDKKKINRSHHNSLTHSTHTNNNKENSLKRTLDSSNSNFGLEDSNTSKFFFFFWSVRVGLHHSSYWFKLLFLTDWLNIRWNCSRKCLIGSFFPPRLFYFYWLLHFLLSQVSQLSVTHKIKPTSPRTLVSRKTPTHRAVSHHQNSQNPRLENETQVRIKNLL